MALPPFKPGAKPAVMPTNPGRSSGVQPNAPRPMAGVGGGQLLDKLKLGSGLGVGGAGGLGGGGGMARRTERLTKAGYTGPMPGTQALKDARAAGQTPIKDFRQANPGVMGPGRPAGAPAPRPMPSTPGNTGIVPPGMGGSPVPRPMGAGPRPMLGSMAPNAPKPMMPRMAEGGKVKKPLGPTKKISSGTKASPAKKVPPHREAPKPNLRRFCAEGGPVATGGASRKKQVLTKK